MTEHSYLLLEGGDRTASEYNYGANLTCKATLRGLQKGGGEIPYEKSTERQQKKSIQTGTNSELYRLRSIF